MRVNLVVNFYCRSEINFYSIKTSAKEIVNSGK